MGPNLGSPGGWRYGVVADVGRITPVTGRQLNTESSPTALPASQTVTKQQAEGLFVLDQRALRHIGLYTVKPCLKGMSQIKGIAGITHPRLGEESRNEPGIW
jgi:hypothetical protein